MIRRTRSNSSLPRGFTLVEIVLVMLITTIIAIVGMPMLSDGMDDTSISAFSRQLLTDLYTAQSMAVKESCRYAVQFDLANQNYSVLKVTSISGTTLTGTVATNPLTIRPWTCSVSQSYRTRGIQITSADFGGKAWVAYDALGAPDNPGTAQVRAGNKSRRLSVDAGSGVISVTPVLPGP